MGPAAWWMEAWQQEKGGGMAGEEGRLDWLVGGGTVAWDGRGEGVVVWVVAGGRRRGGMWGRRGRAEGVEGMVGRAAGRWGNVEYVV